MADNKNYGIPQTGNRQATVKALKEKAKDPDFMGNTLRNFAKDLLRSADARKKYGLSVDDARKLEQQSNSYRQKYSEYFIGGKSQDPKQWRASAEAEMSAFQAGSRANAVDPLGQFFEGVGYGIAAPFAMASEQRSGRDASRLLRNPYRGNTAADIGVNVGLTLGTEFGPKIAGTAGQVVAGRAASIPLSYLSVLIPPQAKVARGIAGAANLAATLGAGYFGGQAASGFVASKQPQAYLNDAARAEINKRFATPESTLASSALDLGMYLPVQRSPTGELTMFGGYGLRGATQRLLRDPSMISDPDILDPIADVTERTISTFSDIAQAKEANELAKRRFFERTGRIGTEEDWVGEGYTTDSQLLTRTTLSALASGFGGLGRIASGQPLLDMIANRRRNNVPVAPPAAPPVAPAQTMPAPVTGQQQPQIPAPSAVPQATVPSPASQGGTTTLPALPQATPGKVRTPVVVPVPGQPGASTTIAIEHSPKWSEQGSVVPMVNLPQGMAGAINNNIANKGISKNFVPVQGGKAAVTSITPTGEFAFSFVNDADQTTQTVVAPYSALPPQLQPIAMNAVTNLPGGQSPDPNYIQNIQPSYNTAVDTNEAYIADPKAASWFQYRINVNGTFIPVGIGSDSDIGKDNVTVTTPTSRFVVPKTSILDVQGQPVPPNTIGVSKGNPSKRLSDIKKSVSRTLPGFNMNLLASPNSTGEDWKSSFTGTAAAGLTPEVLQSQQVFPGARVTVQVGSGTDGRRDAVVVGDLVQFDMGDGTMGAGIPVKLVDQMNVEPFLAPANLIKPFAPIGEGEGVPVDAAATPDVAEAKAQANQQVLDLVQQSAQQAIKSAQDAQSAGKPVNTEAIQNVIEEDIAEVEEALANNDPRALQVAVNKINQHNSYTETFTDGAIKSSTVDVDDLPFVDTTTTPSSGRPAGEQSVFGGDVKPFRPANKYTFPYGEQFTQPVKDEDLPAELRGRENEYQYYAQSSGEEVNRVAPEDRLSGVPQDFLGELTTVAGRVKVPKQASDVTVEIKTVANQQQFEKRLIDVWGQSEQQAKALGKFVDRMALGWAMEQARLAGINTKQTLRALRLFEELELRPAVRGKDQWRQTYREQTILNPAKENLKLIRQLKGAFYTQRLGAIAELTLDQAKALQSPGATQSFKGRDDQILNVAFAIKGPGAFNAQVHELVHLLTRSMYAPTFHELAASMVGGWRQQFVQDGLNKVLTKDLEERMVTALTNAIFEADTKKPLLSERYSEGGASHDAALNQMFNQIGQLMRDSLGLVPGEMETFRDDLDLNKTVGWAIPFNRKSQYRTGTVLLYRESTTENWRDVVLAEDVDAANIGTGGTKQIRVKEFDPAINNFGPVFTIKNIETLVSDTPTEADRLRIGQTYASMANAANALAVKRKDRFSPQAASIFARMMGHWVEHNNAMLDRLTDDLNISEVQFEPVSVVDITRRAVGYQWWKNQQDYLDFVNEDKPLGFPETLISQLQGDKAGKRLRGRINYSYLGWLDRGGYESYLPFSEIKKIEYGGAVSDAPATPQVKEDIVVKSEGSIDSTDERSVNVDPIDLDSDDDDPFAAMSGLVVPSEPMTEVVPSKPLTEAEQAKDEELAEATEKTPPKFVAHMKSERMLAKMRQLAKVPASEWNAGKAEAVIDEILSAPKGQNWFATTVNFRFFQEFGERQFVLNNSGIRAIYRPNVPDGFNDAYQTYVTTSIASLRELFNRLTPDGNGGFTYWDYDSAGKIYRIKRATIGENPLENGTLQSLMRMAVQRGIASGTSDVRSGFAGGMSSSELYRDPVYVLQQKLPRLHERYQSLTDEEVSRYHLRAVQIYEGIQSLKYRRKENKYRSIESMTDEQLKEYGLTPDIRKKLIEFSKQDTWPALISNYAYKNGLNVPLLEAWQITNLWNATETTKAEGKVLPAFKLEVGKGLYVIDVTAEKFAKELPYAEEAIASFEIERAKYKNIQSQEDDLLAFEKAVGDNLSPEALALEETAKSNDQIEMERAQEIYGRVDAFQSSYKDYIVSSEWTDNRDRRASVVNELKQLAVQQFPDVNPKIRNAAIKEFTNSFMDLSVEGIAKHIVNLKSALTKTDLHETRKEALQIELDMTVQGLNNVESVLTEKLASIQETLESGARLGKILDDVIDKLNSPSILPAQRATAFQQLNVGLSATSLKDALDNARSGGVFAEVINRYRSENKAAGRSQDQGLAEAITYIKSAVERGFGYEQERARTNFLPQNFVAIRNFLNPVEMKLLESRRVARAIRPLGLDKKLDLSQSAQRWLTSVGNEKLDASQKSLIDTMSAREKINYSKLMEVRGAGSASDMLDVLFAAADGELGKTVSDLMGGLSHAERMHVLLNVIKDPKGFVQTFVQLQTLSADGNFNKSVNATLNKKRENYTNSLQTAAYQLDKLMASKTATPEQIKEVEIRVQRFETLVKTVDQRIEDLKNIKSLVEERSKIRAQKNALDAVKDKAKFEELSSAEKAINNRVKALGNMPEVVESFAPQVELLSNQIASASKVPSQNVQSVRRQQIEEMVRVIREIAIIPPDGDFVPARDADLVRTTFAVQSPKEVDAAIAKWVKEKTPLRSNGQDVTVEALYPTNTYTKILASYKLSFPETQVLTDLQLAAIVRTNRGDNPNPYELAAVMNKLRNQRDTHIRNPLNEWLSKQKKAMDQPTFREMNRYMDENNFTEEQRLAALSVLTRAMQVRVADELRGFVIVNKRAPIEQDLPAIAKLAFENQKGKEKKTELQLFNMTKSQFKSLESVQSLYGLDAMSQSFVGTKTEITRRSEDGSTDEVTTYFGSAISLSSRILNSADARIVRASIHDQLAVVPNLFDAKQDGEKDVAVTTDGKIYNAIKRATGLEVSAKELSRIKTSLSASSIKEIAGRESGYWTGSTKVKAFTRKELPSQLELRPGLEKLSKASSQMQKIKEDSLESRIAVHSSVTAARAVKDAVEVLSTLDLPIFKYIDRSQLHLLFTSVIPFKTGTSFNDQTAIQNAAKVFADAIVDDMLFARVSIIDAVSNPKYDKYRYAYNPDTGLVTVTDSISKKHIYTISYKDKLVFEVLPDGTEQPVSSTKGGSQQALQRFIGFGLTSKNPEAVQLIKDTVDSLESIRVVPAVYWHGMNRFEGEKTLLDSDVEPMYMSGLKTNISSIYESAGATDPTTQSLYVHPVVTAWTRPDANGFQRVALTNDGMPYYDDFGYSVFTADRKRSQVYANLVGHGLTRDKALEVYALTEHPVFQAWKAGDLVESIELSTPGSRLEQGRYLDPKLKKSIRSAVQAQELILAIDKFVSKPTKKNFSKFAFAFDEVKQIGPFFNDNEFAAKIKSIAEMSIEDQKDNVMSFRPIAETILKASYGDNYVAARGAVDSYTGMVESMQEVTTGKPFTALAFTNMTDSMLGYSAKGVKSFDFASGLYKNESRQATPSWVKFENPLVYDARNNMVTTDDLKRLMESAFKDGRDGVVIQNVRDHWNQPTSKNVAFTLNDDNVLPVAQMISPKVGGNRPVFEDDVEPMYMSGLKAPVSATTIPSGAVIPTVPSSRTAKDLAEDAFSVVLDTAQDVARMSLSSDFALTGIQAGRALMGIITGRPMDTVFAIKALTMSAAGLAPNLSISIPGGKGKPPIKIGFDKLGRRVFMNLYLSMSKDPLFKSLREANASLHMIAMERNIEQERMRRFTAAGGSVPYQDIELDLMEFDEGGNMTDFFGNKSLIAKLPLRGMFERQMSLQHDILLFEMIRYQAVTNPAFSGIPQDQLGKDPLFRSFVQFMGMTMGDMQYSSNEQTDMKMGRIMKVLMVAPRWNLANVLAFPVVNQMVSDYYRKSPKLKQLMGSDPRAFYMRGKVPKLLGKPENKKLLNYMRSQTYGTFLWWLGLPMLVRLVGQFYPDTILGRIGGVPNRRISSFRLGDYIVSESTGSTDVLDVIQRTLNSASEVNLQEKAKFGETVQETNVDKIMNVVNKSILYRAGPMLTRPLSGLIGEDVVGNPVWLKSKEAINFWSEGLPGSVAGIMREVFGQEMMTSNAAWSYMPAYIQDYAKTMEEAKEYGHPPEVAAVEARKAMLLSGLGFRVSYQPYLTDKQRKDQMFRSRQEYLQTKKGPNIFELIGTGQLMKGVTSGL